MNNEELFTRCPTCKTVFRTFEAQLAVQDGKVRCGHCRMVFDGRTHLVDLAPQLAAADEEEARGPPTVTLRDSMALEPVHPNHVEPQSGKPFSVVTEPPANPDTEPDTEPDIEPDIEPVIAALPPPSPMEVTDDAVVPYHWNGKSAARLSPGVRWALGMASFVLFLLLAGQALFQFRHTIAANYPHFRPNLVAACALIGCSVDAVRSRDEVTIESHDLQADPAHQGLLILQVTLRNRAPHAVAFPHVELEILDLGGQPQVRRAFAPVEYAGGAADFARGMPAYGEWNVKLFIDASSVSARGYNLDLFYP